VAPVRALPRNERELFIAAGNAHVLAFDNLSGLPPWLSDTLCRLTSGGAFSTRRLFTDQDEILFAAARPVILNGIEDIITRADLADRAILLTLAAISERQRRPEKTLWREFELARPRILRALLDAAAHGLHVLPHVRLHRFPRMADFAPQPARAHFGPRVPSKPLIPSTGATRSRTSSTPIRWRPLCARSWPTERSGREAHPTFCRSAPTGLAGQRVPAHSLADCAGHRASSARSGLRLSSPARGSWERGQSG
jgi:hypothetical protein